ncbi:MAG TPA: transglycosylase SLT domain-containing protein [Gammaproteobacteria bacterium]
MRAATLSLCLSAAALLVAPLQTQAETVNLPLRVDDYNTKYDSYFQHYSQRFFGPFVDWRWFKAQAVAESLLNPQAESHAGALGVMQLLPRTFYEVRLQHPYFNDIYTPRWNIAAGIYYNLTLYQMWNGALHGDDRFLLTLASYNAGFQRVRNAYARTGRVRSYYDIRQRLPGETQAYVDRIKSLMEPKVVEEAPVVANLMIQ